MTNWLSGVNVSVKGTGELGSIGEYWRRGLWGDGYTGEKVEKPPSVI